MVSLYFLCFQKLTTGNSLDNWSISELVQALILLSHVHSLCSFVYGCGVKKEIDHHGGFSYRPTSESNGNESDYHSDSNSNDKVCIFNPFTPADCFNKFNPKQ